jgi:CO dehydrogenase nickel-insertion accessory protein CooC1
MEVAIAGEGGAGKTTLSGTLARQLARQGYEVLALDNDLNPTFSLTKRAGVAPLDYNRGARAVEPIRVLLENWGRIDELRSFAFATT